MDPRLDEVRIRVTRMVEKIDRYKEPYIEILNIVDSVEADTVSVEYALAEIMKRMDLINPPRVLGKARKHLYVVKEGRQELMDRIAGGLDESDFT